MALWIPQHFDLPSGHRVTLLDARVDIAGPGAANAKIVSFAPISRELANAQAIVLRQAAKRLEEIGKGLI